MMKLFFLFTAIVQGMDVEDTTQRVGDLSLEPPSCSMGNVEALRELLRRDQEKIGLGLGVTDYQIFVKDVDFQKTWTLRVNREVTVGGRRNNS